jgi:cation diffusion facilitator family transporter
MATNRIRIIRNVLWVILALNWAVAAAKLAVGWRVDSLSMIADGFHSLLDGSSNVIGLVGIHFAAQPPDVDHPYGHHKFEAMAALAIGVLLSLTALEVVRAGIERFDNPVLPRTDLLSIAVMAVTMAVNWGVSRTEASWGKRLNSDLLLVDAQHTFSDLFVSASVLVGLGAAWLQVAWLDVAVAFLIAAFIIRISYQVLKQVAGTLTDTAYVTQEEVRAVVGQVSAVRVCKSVRTRGLPPYLFIDLEIEVDPGLTLAQAHAIAHDVVDRCKVALQATDVVVHVEPADSRA